VLHLPIEKHRGSLPNEEKANEVLSISKADELAIPKKLQEFIHVAKGFFQVTD
jgi:hypothetical protein